MSIFNRTVDRPVLVTVVFGLLLALGLYTLGDVSVALYPEMTMPRISVSTSWSGAGPESMEESVTRVVEAALVNVEGLKSLTSTSGEGTSRVTLEFGYDADLDAVTTDIRNKLSSLTNSLPDDAGTPSVFKFDMSSMPIMRIALSGNRSADDLRILGENYVQPAMEQIVGVAEAAVQGGRTRIVRIEIAQNRLDAYGLTLSGVGAILAKQNYELGGGSIVEGGKNWSIRTKGSFDSVQAIADTVVGTSNGYGVKLSDIATVQIGYQDETSFVDINGTTGIYLSIQKESGSNSVLVGEAVREKMESLKSVLPRDVSMTVVSDDTRTVTSTIDNLVSSALQGALLAMVVVFIFLRNIKSTIIVGLSIPISVMITMLAMRLAGLTLNLMTLTGLILGVGMIVDGAIVNLENIHTYRERGARAKVAAMLGSAEMRAPIIASTLTTICVFVPVIFFKNELGMIGQIFQDMIFTIVISLVSSLFVAIFLVPVLSSHWLRLDTRTQKPLKNPVLARADALMEGLINRLQEAYRRSLQVAVNHRLMTTLIILILLAGSLFLASRMTISFTPETNDDSITLSVAFQPGTSYAEVKETMTQLEQIIQSEVRGVENLVVTGSDGSSSRGGNSTPSGEISITLPELKDRIDSSDMVKQKLRAHTKDFPGVSMSFGRSRGGQLSSSSPISIKIISNDYDAALATGLEIRQLVEDRIPQAVDVEMDTTEGLPEIEVAIDRERAYEFGVNISTVAAEIRYALKGYTATTFRYQGEDTDVVLLLQTRDRQETLDLERIHVTTTSGTRIPVASIARVVKSTGPVTINREDQTRVIKLTANVATGAAVKDVEDRVRSLIDSEVILPDSVRLDFAGQWADIQETGSLLFLVLGMAIALVFGVMAGQYESFKDPFINLFTIPLMIIGVVLIYQFTGQAVSMFTMVGLVMLAGIVVNNGIVLVDYTNLLRNRGMGVNEACVQGGANRLKPVLMTTLTTIIGMVPMAFNPGENSELIQPIGLTVIGGLASSTLMTLYFIPVMYSLLNRGKKDARKAREKAAMAVQAGEEQS